MFFLICFHLLNYLRPFWHNIQCIYYITYYTVYLCDIYTHTHARLHAHRSVLAHAHIYKQTIRQQNKNDVCLAIPPRGNEQHSLPDSYASVPAVALKTTAVMVPQCDVFPVESCLEEATAKEQSWVQHALPLLETELATGDIIAWAAYHASMQPVVEDPPALCALLPLFYEKSATPAMIKHGMDVERQAIEFLNPGQIPITTFDQPLFALAKFVQWRLHTEMALWNTLGVVLEGSGWTAALTQADVASSGTADSFLKATHLTRTRHAHQVTLLTLHKLREEAFMLTAGSKYVDSITAWRNDMQKKSPTFMYWDLIMMYETLILIFVRAHTERRISLYI